jgi:hypothetical protein
MITNYMYYGMYDNKAIDVKLYMFSSSRDLPSVGDRDNQLRDDIIVQ